MLSEGAGDEKILYIVGKMQFLAGLDEVSPMSLAHLKKKTYCKNANYLRS
jgi:hypothetical protein